MENLKEDKILYEYFRKFRIACMGQVENSTFQIWHNNTMWDLYAAGHHGICMAYKFKKNFFLKNEKSFLKKVQYIDNPVYDPKKFIWEDGLALKYSRYSYEDEHRLILHLNQDDTKPTLISLDDGIEIVEIIFGLKCSLSDRNKIISLTKEMGCIYYQITLNPANHFQLVRTMLDSVLA